MQIAHHQQGHAAIFLLKTDDYHGHGISPLSAVATCDTGMPQRPAQAASPPKVPLEQAFKKRKLLEMAALDAAQYPALSAPAPANEMVLQLSSPTCETAPLTPSPKVHFCADDRCTLEHSTDSNHIDDGYRYSCKGFRDSLTPIPVTGGGCSSTDLCKTARMECFAACLQCNSGSAVLQHLAMCLAAQKQD